ncbi:hypothetical protein HER21_31535 [Pseudomonas sp. BGM005]|nr:hypothetical protein [Pseudomonas sp. BG5]
MDALTAIKELGPLAEGKSGTANQPKRLSTLAQRFILKNEASVNNPNRHIEIK